MVVTGAETAINEARLKLRWKEDYVSEGINRKLFGVVPVGFYSGFKLSVGATNRTVRVGEGYVEGNVGTGVSSGYLYDTTNNYSIAVFQDASGIQSTVQIPPGMYIDIPLPAGAGDPTGIRYYVVLDVSYSINQTTTAKLQIVDTTEVAIIRPHLLVVGYVDVPAGTTALTSASFGYFDQVYPRAVPYLSRRRKTIAAADASGVSYTVTALDGTIEADLTLGHATVNLSVARDYQKLSFKIIKAHPTELYSMRLNCGGGLSVESPDGTIVPSGQMVSFSDQGRGESYYYNAEQLTWYRR